jgi:hypothetical protein
MLLPPTPILTEYPTHLLKNAVRSEALFKQTQSNHMDKFGDLNSTILDGLCLSLLQSTGTTIWRLITAMDAKDKQEQQE